MNMQRLHAAALLALSGGFAAHLGGPSFEAVVESMKRDELVEGKSPNDSAHTYEIKGAVYGCVLTAKGLNEAERIRLALSRSGIELAS